MIASAPAIGGAMMLPQSVARPFPTEALRGYPMAPPSPAGFVGSHRALSSSAPFAGVQPLSSPLAGQRALRSEPLLGDPWQVPPSSPSGTAPWRVSPPGSPLSSMRQVAPSSAPLPAPARQFSPPGSPMSAVHRSFSGPVTVPFPPPQSPVAVASRRVSDGVRRDDLWENPALGMGDSQRVIGGSSHHTAPRISPPAEMRIDTSPLASPQLAGRDVLGAPQTTAFIGRSISAPQPSAQAYLAAPFGAQLPSFGQRSSEVPVYEALPYPQGSPSSTRRELSPSSRTRSLQSPSAGSLPSPPQGFLPDDTQSGWRPPAGIVRSSSNPEPTWQPRGMETLEEHQPLQPGLTRSPCSHKEWPTWQTVQQRNQQAKKLLLQGSSLKREAAKLNSKYRPASGLKNMTQLRPELLPQLDITPQMQANNRAQRGLIERSLAALVSDAGGNDECVDADATPVGSQATPSGIFDELSPFDKLSPLEPLRATPAADVDEIDWTMAACGGEEDREVIADLMQSIPTTETVWLSNQMQEVDVVATGTTAAVASTGKPAKTRARKNSKGDSSGQLWAFAVDDVSHALQEAAQRAKRKNRQLAGQNHKLATRNKRNGQGSWKATESPKMTCRESPRMTCRSTPVKRGTRYDTAKAEVDVNLPDEVDEPGHLSTSPMGSLSTSALTGYTG